LHVLPDASNLSEHLEILLIRGPSVTLRHLPLDGVEVIEDSIEPRSVELLPIELSHFLEKSLSSAEVLEGAHSAVMSFRGDVLLNEKKLLICSEDGAPRIVDVERATELSSAGHLSADEF
jgi:hypothetical protein